jgi:hypothetical protein
MIARDMTTIRPKIGLGTLRFGASREEARAYLSTDAPTSDGGASWEWWDFEVLGICAAFDSDHNRRLVAFRSERADSVLFGKRLIGLAESPALDLAKASGLGAFTASDLVYGWQAEFDDHDLELCFLNGVCDAISWRVYTDTRDRTWFPPRLRAQKGTAG